MRRLLSLCLVLSLAASARAADAPPKPNTLTPKEIADGWILLWDGETTFGWRSPNDSKWTIAEGMLAPQTDKPGLLVTTSPFKDYELVFDFQRKPQSKAVVSVGCGAEGEPGADADARTVKLQDFGSGGWTRAEVEVKGGYAQGKVYRPLGATLQAPRGVPTRLIPDDKRHDKSGNIVLSGSGVVFRNIKLIPLHAKLLFNGKDLSGWKEFPGKKSKFNVTKDGNIHLEGGPGDLQTEGQWADFVLQLDCISNGDHCNSGVFFRCIPAEFENGYEAQIRNEFTAAPKQEYNIEEYDPKTHELKGEKKEKYTAVDYGTGAIYRRAPARKELSKDRQWFGMTIVASGRHIATWVNGVQAVDWTDERPTADNPRKGCRLEKGAISLQGHEAAVEDLDFRNIRIQDLTTTEEKKP
ncbi:MAG TPA: hypothetical protein DDY78_21825 [Planctomycetales bacterium]|jgi:hypothetical protein|nr:hypothetical protein [Planctomycetales bacterium]